MTEAEIRNIVFIIDIYEDLGLLIESFAIITIYVVFPQTIYVYNMVFMYLQQYVRSH